MIASIPPKGNTTQELFAFWENFLTPDDINTILSLPQWHDNQTAQIGAPSNSTVDEKIRKTQIAWWYPCEKTQAIWTKFIETVADVNNIYFHYDLSGMYEAAQLGLYKADDNGHYDWHVDFDYSNPRAVPRKLSMVMLLSDPSEFEGGELQFKCQHDEAITVEQKKGRAYFFPSYTLHKVTPVTKGIRRSLVLWVGGPPFK